MTYFHQHTHSSVPARYIETSERTKVSITNSYWGEKLNSRWQKHCKLWERIWGEWTAGTKWTLVELWPCSDSCLLDCHNTLLLLFVGQVFLHFLHNSVLPPLIIKKGHKRNDRIRGQMNQILKHHTMHDFYLGILNTHLSVFSQMVLNPRSHHPWIIKHLKEPLLALWISASAVKWRQIAVLFVGTWKKTP